MPDDPQGKQDYSDESDAMESLFRDRYEEGSEWCQEVHEEARKDFEMYAGHQWSEEDEAWGKERQYPVLTLNQIFSIVNAPSSSEIVNRFEPKYLPRLPEDQSLADKSTQAARYVRQQAGAEFVDSGAFRDTLTCGYGVSDWYFDETLGRDGLIQVTRESIESYIWDPATRKQNMEDRTWHIRCVPMSEDEFSVVFPEADMPEASKGGKSDFSMWGRSTKHVTDVVGYAGGAKHGFYFPSKRTVLVFEMQDYVLETEYVLEAGERVSAKEFAKLKEISKQAGKAPPLGKPRKKRRYRRSFFAGTNFIRTEELPGNVFSTSFMTCFEDQTSEGMRWFGLVRPLRDPQKIANRGYSQMVHIMATNPKGLMLHEEGVFENEEEADRQWAKANGRVKVRPGVLRDKRMEIIKGQYPEDFERITNLSMNVVPRIAGIDPYFMGSGGGDLRRVSGTALSQVLQQGQMMLSIPFDGLRKYRIEQGGILLEYMREFMPPESLIRVVGEANAEEFMQFATADLDNVYFDIVVGEVPVSPTAQREAWTALTESGALKSLVDHEWLDGEDIADLAADWPEEVRDRVRKRAAERKQMQQQMMLAQAQGQAPGGQGQPPPQIQ